MKPNPFKSCLPASCLMLLLFLAACGNTLDAKQERSLDGVKLVAPEITDGEDTRSFGQPRYTLDDRHRLLIRYESLSAAANTVSIESGRKVQVWLGPEATDSEQSAASLADLQSAVRVCPLRRNWMMAATWKRAHPFARSGDWSSDGGDFSPSECVQSTTTEGDGALFDVTAWFRSYVRGRGQNYGLIVISPGREITITGDESGYRSPRMKWETVPSTVQFSPL